MKKIKLALIISALISSNIALADLNTGLVAHWNFDECTAVDTSGNIHDAIIAGSPRCETGIQGKSFNFHGGNDYISLLSSPAFTISKVTLSTWINVTSGGINNPRIISAGLSGSSAQTYALWLEGTGKKRKVIFNMSDYNSSTSLTSTTTITNGSGWHYLVGTYDGQISKLYVDGKLNAKIKTTQPLTSSDVISIGDSDNGLDDFIGSIDEVRIYKRALTADEIQSFYYQVYHPIIKGTAPWGASHLVTCENITQGTTLVLSQTTASAWDCEKAGLTINSGDDVVVSIKGKKY